MKQYCFREKDFFIFSMNAKELTDLSYSISYWSNEELEGHMQSFLPAVFSCIDRPEIQKPAIKIIQQLKERSKSSTVRMRAFLHF